MEKFKLLLLIGCLSISLYSCLGDSPTTMVLGAREGVVEIVDGTKLIHLKEHVFYASNFQNTGVDNGACYLFDIRFDSGDPLNKTSVVEDSTGYYTGEILTSYGPIQKYELVTTLTDTTVAYKDDRLVAAMYDQKYALIKENLFLYTELKDLMRDEENSFTLSINMEQNFEADEQDRKIYDFYLRPTRIKVGADSTIVKERLVNVFDISEFLREAAYSPKEDNIKEYNFRINYPTAFNSDTTNCLWSRTTNVYKVEVWENN